jgi:hypothetical protein
MAISDGTVLPNYLQRGDAPSARHMDQNDLRLRVGRVVAVYPPDASANSNKTYYEYDVEVDIGAGVTRIYPRAMMADPLGGLADHVEWTPRASSGKSTTLDTGSRVLLLCISGHSGRSLIVGGAKHHGRTTKDNASDGHHFNFEFNGIQVGINKDGDLTITHHGATAADGKVKSDSSDTNGTSITLDTKGDVHIATGQNADTEIHLDSGGKKVWVSSKTGEVEVDAGSNIKLQSTGVLTGAATDATMMGTTYRSAEAIMHATVMPLLVSLTTALATAGTSLATAGAQLQAAGIAQKVPIAGAVAASVPLQAASAATIAAATAITSTGPLVAQIMTAIQTFEGKALTYLSKKNQSD